MCGHREHTQLEQWNRYLLHGSSPRNGLKNSLRGEQLLVHKNPIRLNYHNHTKYDFEAGWGKKAEREFKGWTESP